MKILSGEQIRAADQQTIKIQGIRSDELMERAGLATFQWLHQQLNGSPVVFHIFCGIGNNGGDGLVIARHLLEHGYNIKVYIVNYSDKRSPDFLINLDRLKDRKVWPEVIGNDSKLPDIPKEDMVLDAIFGTGLNRTPDTWVTELISHINDSKAFVISVDIASGLFLDKVFENEQSVVKANYVLTFQFPKLIFFLPETGIYCENSVVLDIGLDKDYVSSLKNTFHFIQRQEILELYQFRKKFAHKGTYGHAVIVGGSHGKIGAVALSAKACLKSGSGLVTTFVPQCGYLPLQASVPEIMVLTDKENQEISEIEIPFKPTVIGIGMGMGTTEVVLNAFEKFLKSNTIPLVIDADGLNLLSKQKSLLKHLPPQTVLTPHPKELERLIGPWQDDFEKLEKAQKFSDKYNCILVLKGAHSITLYKEQGYVNSTGNPGMATAGSGDVLTGMITALIAQGYTALDAAIMGVYLHGRAGDLCLESQGMESLIASDIIDSLGGVFKEFFTEEIKEEGKKSTS
ncbi:NAD(P)H-hydrate dehydratase [Muriicola soli]|uniref:Bifunctional NAD(P)H-hydrate repair enzyme n=1 Tax=Muriicola soli TaxID=2507538 RepID=A0A411E7V3_9FLAO|nr:NAD(P)H-hydrate dehydratase [Muriicola soli]QBA63801.1 NAD(P)H-hydrate dehydratase [Muriicola soli]